MKGSLGLFRTPFRWGGMLTKNYEMDAEEWAQVIQAAKKCYVCGGVMRNMRSKSGTLLAIQYPYCGSYKILHGKKKGFYHFKILCRACAYAYGKGVIEMDGNTYKDYYDFSEAKYKKEIKGEMDEK